MKRHKRKFLVPGSFLFILSMSLSLWTRAFATGDLNSIDLQAELKKAAPAIPHHVIKNPVPLDWESDDTPEAASWSEYSFDVINQYFDELDRAQDMQIFCPRYPLLNRDERIMAWAELMVAISYGESSYDPLNRTLEDDGGIDDVTGKPVYSEGLLQLSYQDTLSNPYCAFDWDKDKKLAVDDPHRTILNPYNNLYCGIRTMADLIRDNKTIIVTEGGYWSTIQAGVAGGDLNNVESQVRNFSPCALPTVSPSPSPSLTEAPATTRALSTK